MLLGVLDDAGCVASGAGGGTRRDGMTSCENEAFIEELGSLSSRGIKNLVYKCHYEQKNPILVPFLTAVYRFASRQKTIQNTTYLIHHPFSEVNP